MDGVWLRPSEDSIRQQWTQFISTPRSISELKRTALQGRIKSLRSLYWRIFLGQLPSPPTTTSKATSKSCDSDHYLSWQIAIDQSRSVWESIRHRFLSSPDGKWVEESNESHRTRADTLGSISHIRFSSSPQLDLGVNNPLSQDAANPWKVWLSDLELRKTIRQDVIRTFPDLAYFRQPHIQTLLTNVLHVYCKVHPDVGYRQGMHEILAVLVHTLDQDSLTTKTYTPLSSSSVLMHQLFSRDFLEHDSYSLFSLLMTPIKPWYDFNSIVPIRGIPNSSASLATSFGFLPPQISSTPPIPQSSADTSQGTAPLVVERCAQIFYVFLKHIDFQLWAHLDRLEIEPQLWGIRWLRLLFTREFDYEESLMIWDAVLAEDSGGLKLVDFICIAMLLRIRDRLIQSDYNGVLQNLFKYPKPLNGDTMIEVLIYHALLLSRFPGPETSSLIHQQNLDLGLCSEGPLVHDTRVRNHHSHKAQLGMSTCTTAHVLPQGLMTRSLDFDHQTTVGELAKGIYVKAEAFGRNKGILSAIGELRKSYGPTTTAPASALSPSSPISQRSTNGLGPSSSLPHSTKEHSNERNHLLNELRKNHKSNQEIGKVIGLCVQSLEQKIEGEQGLVDTGEALTLSVLKHLRDVTVSGHITGLDISVTKPLVDYQNSIDKFKGERVIKVLEEGVAGQVKLKNSQIGLTNQIEAQDIDHSQPEFNRLRSNQSNINLSTKELKINQASQIISKIPIVTVKTETKTPRSTSQDRLSPTDFLISAPSSRLSSSAEPSIFDRRTPVLRTEGPGQILELINNKRGKGAVASQVLIGNQKIEIDETKDKVSEQNNPSLSDPNPKRKSINRLYKSSNCINFNRLSVHDDPLGVCDQSK